MKKYLLWTNVAAAWLLLVLAGCGGGDGSGYTSTGSLTPGGGPGSGGTTDPGAVVSIGSIVLEGPNELIASGSSANLTLSRGTLVCTVKDSAGVALAGQAVAFYTNGGGSFSTTTATTDAQGIAAVTYNAQNTLGQIKLWAQIGYKKSNELTVNINAGPAAKATVLSSATSVSPSQTATLTVLVTDANTPGYPVAGVSVSGTVTSSASGGPAFLGFSTTDANGQATLTYTAGLGTGTDTITINAGAISKTTTITVTAVAAQIKSLTLTSTKTFIFADGADYTQLRAKVLDGSNAGVAGLPVKFTTSLGGLSSTTSGPGTGTVSVNTNSNGDAVAYLIAGSTTGNALVEAELTAGNYTSLTLPVQAGLPSTVTLASFVPQVKPGEQVDLTATVKDVSGNPVKNETLLFNITTNVSGASLGAFTATTDVLGRATVKYTAGVNALGVDVITVSTSNGKTATVSETVVAALIGSLAVSLGNDNMVADGASQTFVRAVLKDINNQPMTAGVTVAFSTTGGTLSAATAATVSGGIAEVKLTAPAIVGTATVSASAQGIIGSQVVTFTAGAPATIALTANPSSVSIGSAVTLTATVKDGKGNLVPNQAVQFNQTKNLSGGTLSSLSATTDTNGRATVTYTAGGTPTPVDNPATPLVNETDYDKFKAEIVSITSNEVNIAASTAAVRLSSLTLTAVGGTTLVANGSSKTQLDAVALDTNGDGYPNVPITFAASIGSLVDSAGAAVTTVNTDANGVATAFLKSTDSPGISLVTATTGGFNAGTEVSFVPGPAAVAKSTIVAEPNAIPSDGIATTTVTVSLIDANDNPVKDGTSVTLITSAGTITSTNPSTTQSGRAAFTLRSSTTANPSVSLSTPQLAGLTGSVVFGALSDGKPANILLSNSNSHLFVAGVGKTENTNVNVRIVDIDGADIPAVTYNNLRVAWSTHPRGGEYMSGSNYGGVVQRIDNDTNSMLVYAGQGGATLFFQAGTLPGVIEVLFEVVDSTGTALSPAVKATLPQLVISSGAPHTVVLTHPVTNSIENLGGGVYRRIGKGLVTDRYGNSVPDGTAIYLGLTDSILATGTTGSTTASASTFTDLSPKKADGTLTSFTSVSLVRDGVARPIQNNDRILLLNSEANDKSRHVSSKTATTLTANKNFVNTTGSLNYIVAASLLGGFVQGVDAAGNKVTGQAVTKDGVFTFYVTYPANSNSIMTGCISPPSLDTRVDTAGSAQVYIVAASSDDRATTINGGEFCFAPIAGFTLTATPSILSGGGVASLKVVDGGDTVPLPFIPVLANVSSITRGEYGYCTDPAYDNKTQCEAAGVCSDPAYTVKQICEINGFCSDPTYLSESTCNSNGFCSDGTLTSQATCSAAGATWTSNTWTKHAWAATEAWLTKPSDFGVTATSGLTDTSGYYYSTITVTGANIAKGDTANIVYSAGDAPPVTVQVVVP